MEIWRRTKDFLFPKAAGKFVQKILSQKIFLNKIQGQNKVVELWTTIFSTLRSRKNPRIRMRRNWCWRRGGNKNWQRKSIWKNQLFLRVRSDGRALKEISVIRTNWGQDSTQLTNTKEGRKIAQIGNTILGEIKTSFSPNYRQFYKWFRTSPTPNRKMKKNRRRSRSLKRKK